MLACCAIHKVAFPQLHLLTVVLLCKGRTGDRPSSSEDSKDMVAAFCLVLLAEGTLEPAGAFLLLLPAFPLL